MTRTRPIALASFIAAGSLLCGALLASCGTGDDAALRVMAASSLTDAFDELASAFEATDVGAAVDIELIVAGSSRLATQLEEGAPGDVVATADQLTMARIVETGRVHAEPTVFASNTMVVALHPGSVEIDDLADLTDPDILVAMCAEQVPCGALAQDVLAAGAVTLEPTTREPNVRSVLTRVALGEVDAGFVYTTDARAAGADVEVYVPPEANGLATAYPITTLSDDPAALAFFDFVLTDGQEILASYGFLGGAAA